MTARLEKRIALVTGAGSGIGRAIALTFAEAGATVIAADIEGDATQAIVAEIVAQGGHAVGQRCDVTSADDVAALLTLVRTQHGRLDILVNNAGLNVRSDFRHLSDADWQTIRGTNLDSIIRLSRDAFALLQTAGDAGGAVIINLASIMAERGMRQLTAYSATKGAVKALTRGLAVEYAPYGIRVCYLAPGFIETKLTERVLRNAIINKALIDQTPLKRFGTPDDIAKAALFLASDDASFITGSGITVDGGMTAGL
jgi:NAD(P)-dependent dehydrogenase (short-subunit alcohol dehydrogenase family)